MNIAEYAYAAEDNINDDMNDNNDKQSAFEWYYSFK